MFDRFAAWMYKPIRNPLDAMWYRTLAIICGIQLVSDLITGRWWGSVVSLWERFN